MSDSYRIEGSWVVFTDGTRVPVISGGYVAVTVAIIGVVVSAAAAGYGAYATAQAQQQQLQAQKASYEAQAQQQEMQQQALEQSAQAQEAQVRLKNSMMFATMDAQAGRSGVNPWDGSLLQDKRDSAMYGEYNAKIAGYNARTGAAIQGYDSSISMFGSRQAGYRAGQVQSAVPINVGLTTLATAGAGATSIYKAYASPSGSTGSTPYPGPTETDFSSQGL